MSNSILYSIIVAALLLLGCIQTSTTSLQLNGTLQGFIHIGPLCPVERPDHPCLPTNETFQAHALEAVSQQNGQSTVFYGNTPDGSYILSLAPGLYTIQSANKKAGNFGQFDPESIRINPGNSTILNISIDTGIR